MTDMTDITVVIPTRNRSRMLSDLLDSLRVQEAEGLRWEVMVIDNGSTDDTANVVEAKRAGFPVALRYIYEPNPGLHNCRNRGAAEAKGTVVAYLDDDMIVDNHWLQGARLVLEGRAPLVGGRILPLWEAKAPGWIKTMFSSQKIVGYLGLLDLGDKVKAVSAYCVFGGNSFIARDLIFRLKGYHPDSVPQELLRYRGDGETGFAIKFRQHKFVSLYNPIALAYHRITAERLTTDYYCKRAYNQGISDSFTKVRRERGLYGEAKETSKESPGPPIEEQNRFIRFFGTILRFAYHRLSQTVSFPFSRETAKIQARVRRSYQEGFAFHQREVEKDPKLLEWVLRENYLGKNGELPK